MSIRSLRGSPVLFDVHRRRHPILVLLAVALIEFSFLYLVTLLGPPRKFVGIPGAGAALIAVAAATLEGPVVGATAVLIAGFAFTVVTSRFGQDVELLTVLYSTLLWMVAAVAAGLTAEQARRQILARERDLSLALGEAVAGQQAIERLLELAPVFHSQKQQDRLEASIEDAARTSFGADAAWVLTLREDMGAPRPVFSRKSVTPTPRSGTANQEPASLAGAVFITNSAWETEEWHWLRDRAHPEGVTSCLVAPLQTEGPNAHLLVLGWRRERSAPERAEEALLRRFADQAALALERAEVDRLHAQLEAGLSPRLPILHPTLKVEARYRPGESRLGLGGDFFDFLPLAGSGAGFVIGDVSGHGVDAAALGAVLRTSWRTLTLAGTPLRDTVRALDDVLAVERADPSLYATVLVGTIDPAGERVTLVSFGHPAPLLLRPKPSEIQLRHALPLGYWDKEAWPATTLDLTTPWALFLYTDGLVEGLSSPTCRERYGTARLLCGLEEVGLKGSQADSYDQLLLDIEAANGGTFSDDVALLVIERP